VLPHQYHRPDIKEEVVRGAVKVSEDLFQKGPVIFAGEV